MQRINRVFVRMLVVPALISYVSTTIGMWVIVLVLYLESGRLKPVHVWMASVLVPSVLTIFIVARLVPTYVKMKTRGQSPETP